MDSVPKMISTKDLMYLSDMFEWMFTASKKATHYSNEVTDPNIKEVLTIVAAMHAKHCRKITNILNEGGNANGQ